MNIHPGIRTAAALALLGSVLVVSFWVWEFSSHVLSDESTHWADFGSYLGGTLGPVLAFASFIGLLVSVQYQTKARIEEETRADSEVYRINATTSLERAFTTFMGDSGTNVPVSDRLVWLTVARLILSAKLISEKLEVGSIRDMYEADEEFWRRRFYDVLQPMTTSSPLNDAAYFRQGESTLRGNIIDERSIRVIYEFSEWPEGREDPIARIERFYGEELTAMTVGRRGIREYVRSLRRTT